MCACPSLWLEHSAGLGSPSCGKVYCDARVGMACPAAGEVPVPALAPEDLASASGQEPDFVQSGCESPTESGTDAEPDAVESSYLSESSDDDMDVAGGPPTIIGVALSARG